jgi:hypothetical protein
VQKIAEQGEAAGNVFECIRIILMFSTEDSRAFFLFPMGKKKKSSAILMFSTEDS